MASSRAASSRADRAGRVPSPPSVPSPSAACADSDRSASTSRATGSGSTVRPTVATTRRTSRASDDRSARRAVTALAYEPGQLVTAVPRELRGGQGVALRPPDDGRDVALGRRRAADAVHERRDVVVGQGIQRQPADRGGPVQLGDGAVEVLVRRGRRVPQRGHEQDRLRRHAPGEEHQQRQAGRVGPLQVVDDDDHRSPRGRGLEDVEQLGEPAVDLVLAGAGVRGAAGAGGAGRTQARAAACTSGGAPVPRSRRSASTNGANGTLG